MVIWTLTRKAIYAMWAETADLGVIEPDAGSGLILGEAFHREGSQQQARGANVGLPRAEEQEVLLFEGGHAALLHRPQH